MANEKMVENLLWNILTEHEEVILGIKTFEEAGVLTSNAGLVLILEDGSEFQLTIVRSK